MKLDDWMGSLPTELTHIPICQLKIPGSHDSGADSSLSSRLPVANDEDSKAIQILGKWGWIRKGIRRWAITQSQSLRKQLSSGIRYFDFRVSHPPKELRDLTGDFNLVHALYGPTFEESLLELRQFLEEHPFETVLLDVNHVFGMGQQAHNKLKQLIGESLGWVRLCPQMDPQKCTLDFMRAHEYQVIVFMCNDDSGPFWSQDTIISQWPETSKIKKLIAILEKGLEDDRPKFLDRFYVSQGVLTATMKDVNTGYIQQAPSYYQVPSYAPPSPRLRPNAYNPPQTQYQSSNTYQTGRETVQTRPQAPIVETENVEIEQQERVEEQTTTLTYGEVETTTTTTTVPTSATTARKPSRCFINEFGYKCCSVELMRLMLGELDHPQRSLNYRGCNLQRSCTALQMEGQARFNVSLECMVGGSDYPNKGSFLGKFMCKVRSKQGKIAVMYAHPHQYTLGGGVSRPLTQQEFENRRRNNGWSAEDLIETSFGDEDING